MVLCDLVLGSAPIHWGLSPYIVEKWFLNHILIIFGDFGLIFSPENGFLRILRPFEGGFDPKKSPFLEGSWDSSYKPQNLYKPGFLKLVGDFLMQGFEEAVCKFLSFLMI
jgi:hypothetical protein